MNTSNLYKHGFAFRDENNKRDSLYLVWVNLRQRCNNKNRPDYKFYGGKGVKYPKKWDSFKVFNADMRDSFERARRKDPNVSLDRINVEGDYSEENCRWASKREQSNNRKYNRIVEYNGTRKTLREWMEYFDCKLSYIIVYKRFHMRGWTLEDSCKQKKRENRYY